MSFSLIFTLLISIVLHVGLVLLGPAIKLSPIFAKQPDRTEVDLVRRRVPIPEALRPKPLPQVPLPKPLDLKRLLQRKTANERTLNLAVKPKFQAPEPGALPKSKQLPAPPSFNMPKPVLGPGKIPPPKILEGVEAIGEIVLPADTAGESKGLEGGKKASFLDSRTDQSILGELWRSSSSRASRTRRGTFIKGPAAQRRILFRPKPPKLERLESTAEVVLKFWVLADGAVGRVIPIRKANAYLEGLASNHVKRWRFSPLPPGADDTEQWGEITFRFVLR